MIRGFPNGALALIDGRFPLTEKDPGRYRRFKLGTLAVQLQWHEARGLGNVSALTLSARMGLMHTHSLIINPLEREAPLFTFDTLAPLGKRTMRVTLYNTTAQPMPVPALGPLMAAKRMLAALPDHDLEAHWYDDLKLTPSLAKRAGRAQGAKLDEAAWRYLEAWLALCAAAPPAHPGNTKVADYVSGLLERGGPSANAFIKRMGPQQARTLFEEILFGVR